MYRLYHKHLLLTYRDLKVCLYTYIGPIFISSITHVFTHEYEGFYTRLIMLFHLGVITTDEKTRFGVCDDTGAIKFISRQYLTKILLSFKLMYFGITLSLCGYFATYKSRSMRKTPNSYKSQIIINIVVKKAFYLSTLIPDIIKSNTTRLLFITKVSNICFIKVV